MIEFVVTVVLTLVVMYVEVQLTPDKKSDGTLNLRDNSVGVYFVLGLFSSVLILPIYFYVRRGGLGALAGLGFALAVFVLGVLTHIVVLVALQP